MMAWTVNFSTVQSSPASIHPKGGNSRLTAQFKAGKTTLVNTLSKSLADGIPFLGFQPRKLSGRVGIWDYELPDDQGREWFRALKIEHPERISRLPLRGYRIPFQAKAAREWTIEWLKRREVEFWILDPLAALRHEAWGGVLLTAL